MQIDGIEPGEAQAMLDLLLPLGNPLRPDQTVWDQERDQERPIGDFRDAGRLAAEGRLASLHFVLTGMRWRGRSIPEVGVSVWPRTLALDYKPRDTWTAAAAVVGFVDLLCALRDLSGNGRLVLAGETSCSTP